MQEFSKAGQDVLKSTEPAERQELEENLQQLEDRWKVRGNKCREMLEKMYRTED